ncbi:unnamed protein product [Rhizoctonia solani]|uniref:Uncharacterized protein n=1 Tax=Rhizoctonia solani TaxID=456999 RepID=A0A8H2X8E4_9AGAM|nr:unnamed protein product [Rhizoctonia solani]
MDYTCETVWSQPHREISSAHPNHGFSISYGFYYTNTIIGAFFFQQLFYYPFIIGFFTALGYGIQSGTRDDILPFFRQSWQLIPLTVRGGCDLLVSIALWYFLLGTKEFQDWKPSCLGINIDELATGAWTTRNRAITWRGTPRRRGMNLLQARTLRSTRNFLCNALFRRVLPVETRIQALVQHLFSLTAILLLIIRAVSVLRNSDEDLPSRTIVKPCSISRPPTLVYMRLPKYPGAFTNNLYNQINQIMGELTINVSSIHYCRDFNHARGLEVVSTPCNASLLQTETDIYKLYRCQEFAECVDPDHGLPMAAYMMGYEYRIELPLNVTPTSNLLDASYNVYSWLRDHAPSFWLGLESGEPREDEMPPHLSLPIQPTFGWYTVSKSYYALRRFISSSPLLDAVTGSNPRYDETVFFPSSLLRREFIPLNATDANLNNTMRAIGLIYRPEFVEASEETPLSRFKSVGESPENLCEVTEEYRTGSTFDTLASVGGLLALLQGIHVFLFGRPLFWGLFGAKIVAPFGLMGNLATKGFKKRLQERYHHPTQMNGHNGLEHGAGKLQAAVSVDMTQFLLDYVIDMGPASIPNHEEISIESSDSEDETKQEPVRREGYGEEGNCQERSQA